MQVRDAQHGQSGYDASADMWSVGVIAVSRADAKRVYSCESDTLSHQYVMIYGRTPYQPTATASAAASTSSIPILIGRTLDFSPRGLSATPSPSCVQFLASLLSFRPEQRMRSHDALLSPWINAHDVGE
jgi:serine/threonine protein kinase